MAALGVSWAMPRIDQWRGDIAREVGERWGVRVDIDRIDAQWSGLRPRFTVRGIRVYDSAAGAAQPVISLDRLEGELAWRSVWTRRLAWSALTVQGGDFVVTREAERRLRVAGRVIELDSGDGRPMAASAAMQWLKEQADLTVHDVTLRWVDQVRRTAPLVFTELALVVQADGGMHRAMLRATPRNGQGAPLTVMGEVETRWFEADGQGTASPAGRIHAEWPNIDIAQWAAWLPIEGAQGRVSLRAWADATDGRLGRGRLDVRGRGVAWQGSSGQLVRADELAVLLRGDAQVIAACWQPGSPRCGGDGTAPVELNAQARAMTVALPEHFEGMPWTANGLTVDADLAVGATAIQRAELTRVSLHGDDLQAQVHGHWHAQAGQAAGVADLRANIDRAALPAVHRYVPTVISAPVRHWLRDALTGGSLIDAQLVLRGPLMQFPFRRPGDDGEFTLSGALTDARLDYAPHWRADGNTGQWPVLTDFEGNLRIHQAGLTVKADSAWLQGSERLVAVTQTVAHTDDLGADGAVLAVDARTSGQAAAYLDILAASPLGARAGERLAQARARGAMALPLTLSIPLDDTAATAVRGEAMLNGVDFWPAPSIPPVSGLRGRLVVTRDALRADGLVGRWLDGPVRFSGTLSPFGQDLQIDGQADMAAVRDWRGDALPVLARATGTVPYQASLGYEQGSVIRARWESDLRGLALDLPPPFGKSAQADMPVSVDWLPGGERGGGPAVLAATVGQATRMRFERDRVAGRATSSFTRGVVAIGEPADLPRRGLAVTARLDDIDIVRWRDLIDDLSASTIEADSARATGSKATARQPTAPVSLIDQGLRLRVSTPHLVAGRYRFDDARLQAERTPGQDAAEWKAEIEARQAAGYVSWQSAARGKPGRIDARMGRLWLEPTEKGQADASAATDRAAQDLSGYPALSLRVDDFSLHGRALGELRLSGTNVDQGRQWRLDQLTLVNPSASLSAEGVWRAQGERRGLAATVRLAVGDAGGLLDRLGRPGLMEGGHGAVSGRLFWQDSPWQHDLRQLDARFDIDLAEGRFAQVDSASVRLLSLLSLQSLPRLASMDTRAGDAVQGGFAFDAIGSAVRVRQGVLQVDNYAIDGPAARIRLDGESDLVDRTWNLHARVVPNIDASGAALATTLINPLLGAGALVTQWVMRRPLEGALTQQFRVRGDWNDPQIEADSASTDEKKAVPMPDGP